MWWTWMWSDIGYKLLALGLGIVAFFTGEIVTFVMLGFILMALNNINDTLRLLLKQTDTSQNEEV